MKSLSYSPVHAFVLAACAFLIPFRASAALYATFPFAGDSDCGVSTNNIYTHTVNLAGSAVTVNGVTFDPTGSESGDTITGANYVLTVPSRNTFTGAGTSGIGGDIAALFSTFYYSGTPAVPEILTLTGLETNTSYKAVFYNRAWGGPNGRIQQVTDSQGGGVAFDQDWTGSGTGNLFVAHYTTGPEETSITFTNTGYNGIASFHQYGFSNERVAGPPAGVAFSTRTLRSDLDSGLSVSRTYTHLVNFAETRPEGATVNGVLFPYENSGLTGANYSLVMVTPQVAGRWSNLGQGGIGIPISNFAYNGGAHGDPEVLTLTGLQPSTSYRIVFYNQGWGTAGSRWVQIADSLGGVYRFDQNWTGDANGSVLEGDYTTAAAGAGSTSIVFTILQESTGASFHQYVFSNERLDTAPTSLVANPHFTSPDIGAGNFRENNPADSWIGITVGDPWGGGIVADGSGYGNPPAPDGDGQAGLIKGAYCGMYQPVALDTGKTYRIGFNACGRGSYGGYFSVSYAGSAFWFAGVTNLDPSAGGTMSAYQYYLSDPFRPGAPTGALAFLNGSETWGQGVDVCNYVDNVRIEEYVVPPVWGTFETWQTAYFSSPYNPAAAPTADPLGKGLPNLDQFRLGLDPTNPASAFRLVSAERSGSDMILTWKTSGGSAYSPGPRTNLLEVAAVGAGYTNDFASAGVACIIDAPGDTVTNAVDAGGATNAPGRYYRVRAPLP